MNQNERPAAARWSAAVWLAIATALIVAGLASVFVARQERSRLLANESTRRIAHVTEVQSDLLDMETGQRGYLLAGEEQYLQPYDEASSRLRVDTAALIADVSELDARQALGRKLADLARAEGKLLDSSIALHRVGRQPDVLMLFKAGGGKRIMDSVRVVVSEFITREQELQRQREDDERRWATLVSLTIVVGTLFIVAVLLFLRSSLNRYAAAQAAALREMDRQLSAIEEQARLLSTKTTS